MNIIFAAINGLLSGIMSGLLRLSFVFFGIAALTMVFGGVEFIGRFGMWAFYAVQGENMLPPHPSFRDDDEIMSHVKISDFSIGGHPEDDAIIIAMVSSDLPYNINIRVKCETYEIYDGLRGMWFNLIIPAKSENVHVSNDGTLTRGSLTGYHCERVGMSLHDTKWWRPIPE